MPELSLTHLYRPARSGSAPFPALVLLHGLGDDERGMFSLAETLLDSRLAILSVRAPRAHAWGGYAWYDIDRDGPGLGGEGIEASLVQLGRFLVEIVERYEIDSHRIFVGGFSLGAALIGAFTMLEPVRVAGTVMISGFLPPDAGNRYRLAEVAGKAIFQAHGSQDTVVPVKYAHMTRDYLLGAGVDLTYREYIAGHTVTESELGDLASWLQRRLEDTTPLT